MKKIYSLILLMSIIPNMIWAGGVLGDGVKTIAATGSLMGTIIVVAVVAIWLLPVAFGVLVYTGQKKKAEQQHEEVGLKAAIVSLLAVVIGAAMSFYIVGTIGSLAMTNDDATLKQGNSFFLRPIIGKGVSNITGSENNDSIK